MVNAQQIKEFKIRQIRKESKRCRSDDSSHQNPKNRFYHQDSSIGNKDRSPIQNSQGGGHLLRGLCALLMGNNIWVGVLTERIIVLHVVIKDTRLETALTSKKEGTRSIKLP